MGKLENLLTWSVSRDRLFNDCRRAYFYHYYLAWSGWEAMAPEISRKAYLLKNIQGIDAWIGDSVHKVIKWILENKSAGKKVSLDEAKARIKNILVEGWNQSTAKLWEKKVKNNLNLFEHYYKRALTQDTLRSKIKKAVDCITNFYLSGLADKFFALDAKAFLSIDELDGFYLDGVKVFAVPDFAAKGARYELYDWKTGKPSDKDIFQLSFYILYAKYKWAVEPQDVDIIPVYLNEKSFVSVPATPRDLKGVEVYALKSITLMRSVLSDAANNVADIGLCPKTDNLRRCDFCRFKEICV